MPMSTPLLPFLAVIVVSAFVFLTTATWATTHSRERLARERMALLKTLAEQPGENAARILDVLQKGDQARAAKRAIEERRNWTDRGIILVAFGVGVAGMLGVFVGSGVWSVCLLPFLVGLAMILIGLLRNYPAKRDTV